MLRLRNIRLAAFLSLLMFSLMFLAACGTNAPSQPAVTNSSTPQPVSSPPAPSSARPKLNLNTATGAEFQAAIPNLGNRMVHEFEEYRPYRSIQQFRKEIGKYVSADQVAEYEKYVFVPISPNDSDAATLQQIPGLDATEADAMIKGRPYASSQAFIDKLADKISTAEMETARLYVGQ